MTNNPTNLIQQARALCESATPGPWEVYEESDNDGSNARGMQQVGGDGLNKGAEYEIFTPADASFIAAARTLVPELADALAEMLASKKQLRGYCSQHIRNTDKLTRERDDARAECERLRP